MPDKRYLKRQVEGCCGGFARHFDIDAIVDELCDRDVCDIYEMSLDEFTEVLERHDRKGQ